MDTLVGIAMVGVWIAISVVALTRAFSSRGSSPDSSIAATSGPPKPSHGHTCGIEL